MNHDQTIIHFREVKKSYGRVQALDGLSFTAAKYGCLGLLGPNGAGKTTAIKCLLNLTHYESGSVDVQARRIGYVPQQPALFPWMTAEETLRFIGAERGLRGKALEDAIEYRLDQIGLLKAKRRRTGGFSGGMKQRLALAAALIHEPDLLVLDEPVSALDPVGRHDVLALLNVLKRDRAIVMSTHILDDAERVCDDVVIMREGHAALQQSMGQIRVTVNLRYDVELLGEAAAIAAAGALLQTQPYVSGCRQVGSVLALTLHRLEEVPALLHTLASLEDVQVIRLEQSKPSLEDIFLQVVNGQ
ncbi:MAG TPA: ABC transporter ATP-binding protein [Firmicutes bacterium]|jgi:ABC-2 type transport system ATP-binding protein|nr:ABC transporter ATP-binding protein [Bacillota bacterium]